MREKLQSLLTDEERKEELLTALASYLSEDGSAPDLESLFRLNPDNSTLKCCRKSNLFDINFSTSDTLADMLGFSHRDYPAAILFESELPVDIVWPLSLRIETNLTTGVYLNGQLGHAIYEFTPIADPGFIIREEPRTLSYLPLIDGKTLIDNISGYA